MSGFPLRQVPIGTSALLAILFVAQFDEEDPPEQQVTVEHAPPDRVVTAHVHLEVNEFAENVFVHTPVVPAIAYRTLSLP